MKSMKFDRTDALCGLLFIALGGFFAYQSLGLELGTAFRMGPGFFHHSRRHSHPARYGHLVQSGKVEGENRSDRSRQGILLIPAQRIAAGLVVQASRFVPMIFFALIAAFASAPHGAGHGLLLATAITVFSVIVFSYALGHPSRRFRPGSGSQGAHGLSQQSRPRFSAGSPAPIRLPHRRSAQEP